MTKKNTMFMRFTQDELIKIIANHLINELKIPEKNLGNCWFREYISETNCFKEIGCEVQIETDRGSPYR